MSNPYWHCWHKSHGDANQTQSTGIITWLYIINTIVGTLYWICAAMLYVSITFKHLPLLYLCMFFMFLSFNTLFFERTTKWYISNKAALSICHDNKCALGTDGAQCTFKLKKKTHLNKYKILDGTCMLLFCLSVIDVDIQWWVLTSQSPASLSSWGHLNLWSLESLYTATSPLFPTCPVYD